MKATSKSGYGSGWHKQSGRHSFARKYGSTKVYLVDGKDFISAYRDKNHNSFIVESGAGIPRQRMQKQVHSYLTKKYGESPSQKAKVHKVLEEFEHGKLKTHGRKVTERKQALAIALSEAGLSRKGRK